MSKYETEEEFLEHYDSGKYRTPDGYTSDMAVFTIVFNKVDPAVKAPPVGKLKLMLIKRNDKDNEGNPNIEGGKWALPGGFVQEDESAFEAAGRELVEETSVNSIHLKHFGVYDKPGRDPRGWIISNAHYAIVNQEALQKRKAADDANEVELFTLEEIADLELAFDHEEIIKDAVGMIVRDILQTTVAKNFLPNEFTLSELRGVLLTVTDDRKIKEKPVFFKNAINFPHLEMVVGRDGTPKKTNRNSKRPSALYRFTEKVTTPSIWG